MKGFYTSESVGNGQPDRLCDVIADSILDACLEQDKESRVACEVMVKDNNVILGGEITTNAQINLEEIVKNTLLRVGYTYTPKVINLISKQSKDVALGVDDGGAGDQGVMIGYACLETNEYFPLAQAIANSLIRRVEELRETLGFAKPDMKSQVTIDYQTYEKPYVKTIVLSVQTIPNVNLLTIKDVLYEKIVLPVLERYKGRIYDKEIEEFLFNTTGKFEVGGPEADTGVTGRKQPVDAYGTYAPLGGGAICGKDATKVDRSAAYLCRFIAKNIVAAGLLTDCTVQMSYAIGLARCLSFDICTNDKVDPALVIELENFIMSEIDMKPKAIIERFDLKRPLYVKWSNLGSFGQAHKCGVDVPWEQIDADLQAKLKKFKEEKFN